MSQIASQSKNETSPVSVTALQGPSNVPLATILNERRALTRSIISETNVDAVLFYSTREHADPSCWIIGTPCKSDCHYSYIDAQGSGILEMSWRIPGLLPRLTLSEDNIIGVPGELLMKEALNTLVRDKGYNRVGVVGDAPFRHLVELPAEVVDLNIQFSEHLSAVAAPAGLPGMSRQSSIDQLGAYPLSEDDKAHLSERLEILQNHLASNDIDAVLLYGTDKKGQYSRWICGVPSTSPMEVLVITPNSIRAIEIGTGLAPVDNIMAYTIPRVLVQERAGFSEVLQAELARAKTVGVIKECPYSVIASLGGGRDVRDLTEVIEGMMTIKTPQEIQILSDMGRELTQFLEEVLESTPVGSSGSEIQNRLVDCLSNCSGTPSFPIGAAIDEDLRGEDATTLAEPLPTQFFRDAVCIDMGMQRCGLVTDITRMAFSKTSLLKEPYESLCLAVKAVIATIEPNKTTVGDLVSAMKYELRQIGIDPDTLAVDELGHGIGFDLHELPFLALEDQLSEVLRPGMIFCIEPDVRTPHGKIRVEEMVLVTDVGARILTEA